MDEFLEYDGLGLADLIKRGETSAEELLDAALARAAAINPSLNAITVMAEAPARRMIANSLPIGPFTGVPFLLKDLGAEAVDYPTTNS